MNFSLLNPLFLIGLIAVALPVIAHLVSRKKGATHKFSAVSLLLASDRESIRKSNPKDLLLLALRALAIALIALMFAKPATLTDTPVDVSEIKSAAIVIDNSFSMGYDDNFSIAKSRAEEIIEALADGSFAAVFPLVPPPGFKPEITADKGRLKSDISAVALSHSFADNERRLAEIYETLENSPAEGSREVIFLTDSQRNGWSGERFEREWVSAVDVGDGSPPENRSVNYFEVASSGDFISARVIAANYSGNPAEGLPISVSVGDSESSGFISIKARSQEARDFIFPLVEPTADETAAIANLPADKLPADDTRYFMLSRIAQIRALIIDGDPREDARLSETHYLAEALETISEIRAMSLTVKDNEAFLGERLDKYNFVILANVSDITPQKAQELGEFVAQGGATLIFAGERVRAEVYNALLGDILPAQFVGEVREGSYFLSAEGEAFSAEVAGKLPQAGVEKFFKLAPAPESRTMIRVEDGSPILVEKKIGRGRAFVFASTADRAWNGFALCGAFLPAIKEILDLVQSSEGGGRNFTVGDLVKIEFSGVAEAASVKSPAGEEFAVGADNPIFDKTLSPGIYSVNFDGGGYSFAVNVDARESNLDKINLGKPAEKSPRGGGKARATRELWGYFLWAAVVLLIAESAVRSVRRWN
ncbi:MAG: BatA domain-containing protein [Deltaproteobacteria bacterium]